MKKYIVLIIMVTFCLYSCSTVIYRPEIKGFIYDKQTKTPIANVKIITDQGLIESETDSNGFFRLIMVRQKEYFDFERGNDPMVYTVTLAHPLYQSETIEERTRGTFNELKVYDTLYLEKKYTSN